MVSVPAEVIVARLSRLWPQSKSRVPIALPHEGIATEPDDCRADVTENAECMPLFAPVLSKGYVLRQVGAALPLQGLPRAQ